jgi:hypothetical protein
MVNQFNGNPAVCHASISFLKTGVDVSLGEDSPKLLNVTLCQLFHQLGSEILL